MYRTLRLRLSAWVHPLAVSLEAFEQFFRSVPPVSGMAFVPVPHLDPSQLLTEILQRTRAMPVVEVQDQMTVAPNGVYVLPPNRDMANILSSNQSFEGYEVEHDFPAIGHHRILFNARRIVDNAGDTKAILLAMEKIP
jgi:chemotaxis response regulator CheB